MKTSRWPMSHLPISGVTPFTYRDGETYLSMLNRLAQYVTEQLHPSLRETVEHMVEELEHIIAAQHGKYVEGVQDFQRIHDAFMVDVNSALMALNDNAVADLADDPGSVLGTTLRNVFANKEDFDSIVTIYPSFFGATGDGVADDTVALQAWLDASNKNKQLDSGVYRVTGTLNVDHDDVHIHPSQGVLVADHDGVMINVHGDRCVVSVQLDGQNRAQKGVYVNGAQCVIRDSVIHDFFGDGVAVFGVQVETPYGATVTNNTISNIIAVGNDVIGSGRGSARAITITHNTPAQHESFITNNVVDNVGGNEGDAIHVMFLVSDIDHNLNGDTIIQNNTIRNANRRCIKVQASNVRILNNSIRHTLPPDGWEARAIEVIRGSDILVEYNTVESTAHTSGIAISNIADSRGQRNVIAHNKIMVRDVAPNAIYVNYMDHMIIQNNTTRGGVIGIAVGFSSYSYIVGNVVYGLTQEIGENATGISLSQTSDHCVVKDNTSIGGIRFYAFNFNAPHSVFKDNTILHEGPSHVASSTGTINSFIDGTVSTSPRANHSNQGSSSHEYHGLTSVNVSGESHAGTDFSTRIVQAGTPETSKNDQHFRQGTIIYNSSPGSTGAYGWVCTESGIPGTWVELRP